MIFQGYARKIFKDGGVRKLVILSVVPKLQELHENLAIILEKLGISSLEFSYSSDIKMCTFYCSINTSIN